MAAPERKRNLKFFFTASFEMEEWRRRTTTRRNRVARIPLASAITVEGRGMYRIKIPSVPKIIMAKINWPLARVVSSFISPPLKSFLFSPILLLNK